MQRLEITNFSTIDHCEIDINRFTILIGPQATGKSVIAKLIFFFSEFFYKAFKDVILGNFSQPKLEEIAISKFEEIFPRYTWRTDKFRISYTTDNYCITIYNDNFIPNEFQPKMLFSDSIADAIQYSISGYQKYYEKAKFQKISSTSSEWLVQNTALNDLLLTDACARHLFLQLSSDNFFIPAARSFFSSLQRNIFTFLESKAPIDTFLIKFGKDYEQFRRNYGVRLPEKSKAQDTIFKIVNQIIKGKYLYEDGQDWIISKHGKIDITHASSGQQESLPMLVVLSSFLIFYTQEPKARIFIEEPEAHLFPFAQKSIVTLLSLIHSHAETEIFITTHSPYILSAMNILITAHDALTDNNQEQIAAIIGDAAPIRFEDVAAYNVDNGGCTSILDHENRLIGVNIIDEVSDAFDAEFDKLLTLLPTPA